MKQDRFPLICFFGSSLILLVTSCTPSPQKQLREMNLEFTKEAFVATAGAGNKTAVELFLKGGMNVNCKDEKGWSPLSLAVLKHQGEVSPYLLDKEADPNLTDFEDSTALMRAAVSGHRDVVQLLLDAGASGELKDSSGATAWNYATHNQHSDIAELLLEAHRREIGVKTPTP